MPTAISPSTAGAYEVAKQGMPVLGEQRFRMELHAENRQALMGERHYRAVVGACIHDKALGELRIRYNKRMVSRYFETAGKAGEQSGAVVFQRSDASVHRARSAVHLCSEFACNDLMPEAHAQDGDASCCQGNDIAAFAAIIG